MRQKSGPQTLAAEKTAKDMRHAQAGEKRVLSPVNFERQQKMKTEGV